MQTNSPDVVIAMRLLDHATLRGFEFLRVAPDVDGPLVSNRVSGGWVDTIYIEGFSRDCFAWRKRNSPLIVAGNGLMKCQVDDSALDVLNEVLMRWPGGSAGPTWLSAGWCARMAPWPLTVGRSLSLSCCCLAAWRCVVLRPIPARSARTASEAPDEL